MVELGIGFLAKKILGAMLMPLSVVLCLLLLAFFVRCFGRVILSFWLAFTAAIALVVFSHPFFAYHVAAPLENQYTKYDVQPLDAVIVLGGGHSSDERKPPSSLLSAISLMRLTEGIRLLSLNEGSQLWLSGFANQDEISNAEAMSIVAQSLGVPESRITISSSPQDTLDEAVYWAEKTKAEDYPQERIALVTSASHMPRAMYLFSLQGLKPIPAPTNFRSEKPNYSYWRHWLPNAHALELTTAAWHEYLGTIWIKIRSE